MKIELETGNAHDPRLAMPRVRKHLRNVPPEKLPALLLRLTEELHLAQNGAVEWTPDNSDLWPVLLTHSFSEAAVGVLLLAETGSPASTAMGKGAALALPPEEAPLFGLIEDARLKLSDRLSSDAVTVVFTLPEQIEGLRTLLRDIPCRRAVLLSADLQNGGVVRSVRNADVPVFTKRPGASSMLA